MSRARMLQVAAVAPAPAWPSRTGNRLSTSISRHQHRADRVDVPQRVEAQAALRVARCQSPKQRATQPCATSCSGDREQDRERPRSRFSGPACNSRDIAKLYGQPTRAASTVALALAQHLRRVPRTDPAPSSARCRSCRRRPPRPPRARRRSSHVLRVADRLARRPGNCSVQLISGSPSDVQQCAAR